ncbi:MAG: T9SS type A sorting domain-containing protein, partial [Ignavibacteriales bacterium]|nr:T9SS type A sorting domain-containing protein [Ignavibacteriales bacterium]
EFGIALNDRFHFYEKSDVSIPNTPVNFNGYSLDKNTLYMEWKKESPQYLIYKGAKKESLLLVDSVSTGYYKDTSISTGKNYFYAIKARTTGGQLSQYSEIISIYHHAPAKVWDYIISGQNNISLYFTERIKTGAAELSSFSLKTDAGQVIPAITCIPTGEKSMLINFSQSLTPGTYVLQMKNFSDYYGSPVTDTSFPVRFAAKQTDTLFYVESFQLLNSHQFKMVFNLPFDSASVLNSANYSFSPVNFIESISLDGINRSVLVTLKNGRPLGATGIESVLYLSNIYSSAASGRIAIKNKSAGSVLVFSKNAENIDNVYAYPNPVQVNKNNTVTFANLPKYAEIHIFAPTGTKIKTINENDGNGGVTWDLKDETGALVQSGIYFFRVRQLDDNNEELHNKLFKFAVIR